MKMQFGKHVLHESLESGDGCFRLTISASITGKLASSKNEFIFGGKYGIGIGDKNSNTTRLLKSYWSDEERKGGKDVRMRANDGAVDSKGRFWVSTLVDPETSQRARGGEGEMRLDDYAFPNIG